MFTMLVNAQLAVHRVNLLNRKWKCANLVNLNVLPVRNLISVPHAFNILSNLMECVKDSVLKELMQINKQKGANYVPAIVSNARGLGEIKLKISNY